MSSDALRNAWIASGDPQITWRASLGEGDRRAWLRAVLRAGREHAVYTVHEAPAAGYLRERDGELEDARPDDLFDFAASGTRPIDGRRLRVSARLAYVENERVVEDDVEDLGALLARLRPDDVLSAGSLITSTPPLDAHGEAGRVTLATFTDIWLPWVPGLLEDDYELGRPFDNRPLAERHTPRLNAFLAVVRDRTRETGGTWAWDPEFTRVPHDLLDADGLIVL